MQELTVNEMEHVNGAGGGVHVGSDGANNVVGNAVVTPLGGRVDPGGANNVL
jgi:hypothetical protein